MLSLRSGDPRLHHQFQYQQQLASYNGDRRDESSLSSSTSLLVLHSDLAASAAASSSVAKYKLSQGLDYHEGCLLLLLFFFKF